MGSRESIPVANNHEFVSVYIQGGSRMIWTVTSIYGSYVTSNKEIKENDWLIIPKPNNKMTIFGWTSATFANLSRRGDRFSKIPSLFDWTGRCSDHNAASWFALKQFLDVGKIFWNIQTAVKSAILLGMKFWHCTIGDEVVHIIIDVSGWRRRDPQGSGKYFETLPAQN